MAEVIKSIFRQREIEKMYQINMIEKKNCFTLNMNAK